MRFISSISLLLLPLISICQEVVFNEKIRLEYEIEDVRETYTIIDSINNRIVFFLIDNNKINGYLLDNQFKILAKIIVPKDKEFKYIIGHTIKDDAYNLFFTDKKTKKINVASINFIENKGINNELEFELKKERVLEKFSINNKFYILTVKTLSKKLLLYIFDNNNFFSKKEIDLSIYKFNVNDDNLSLLLTTTDGKTNFASNLLKMDPYCPNSLEITINTNKLYYSNNKLILTIDNPKGTNLITIELKDYSYTLKNIPKGKTNSCNSNNTSSNTFLYNSTYLFQILGCKDEMYFSVYNIQSDTIVYEYRVKENENLAINNSQVLQKKNFSFLSKEKFKQLENTNQILKKISEYGYSITAFQTDSNLTISYGTGKSNSSNHPETYRPSNKIEASMQWSMAKPNNQSVVEASFNPTIFNYNSFKEAKDGNVYFKSLFDAEKLTHVEGEIPINAYDQLIEYSCNIKDPISIETVFKKDNSYFFGYYHLNEYVYYLVKFDENK